MHYPDAATHQLAQIVAQAQHTAPQKMQKSREKKGMGDCGGWAVRATAKLLLNNTGSSESSHFK